MSNILESLHVLTSYPDLDINCKEPEGFYPLYTLILMIFERYEWYTPSQQSTNMASLELLLQAGANPNFDEIRHYINAIPRDDVPADIRFDTYRTLFSSSLNGVFISVLSLENMLYNSSIDRSKARHLLELISQMCIILLQHGSNPNYINVSQGTTPLHHLMELWAREPHPYKEIQGYLQLSLCTVQSILLSYGADPNKTTHFRHSTPYSYPVQYYVRECKWQLIRYELWPTMVTRPSHVLRLLKFMDSACATEAGKRIIECCHEFLEEGMPIEALQEIQSHVWLVLHEAQTLLSLSQLAIWKAIGRNFHAAEIRKWLKINIPKKILHDLDNMFVCYCHN